MNASARDLGVWGEKLALGYLSLRGYKVLARNYKCLAGEIDLVAWHRGTLVFVEVKTRASESMGSPEEAVTALKRRQIVRVARFYLKRYAAHDRPCRFDVVGVTRLSGGGHRICVIQDAFGE